VSSGSLPADVPIRPFQPAAKLGGTALGHRHPFVTRRPIFRVTVWGGDPKHQDEAIAFEMYPSARFANDALGQRSIAAAIRIHQAIGVQSRQPLPAERANQFQVSQRAVPAIKTHVARGQAALLGGFEHRPDVIVLGLAIIGRIIQAIIAWDGVRVVPPHQGHEVDAGHNPVMFARPLAMYQGNRARIRFVQGGIVNHQQTARAIDKQFGLLPQRRGIRREPLQEATDAFMRGPMRRIRLHTGGFGTRDHVRCGDQKRDVIEIGHFGCIHARMVAHNASTA
jgi:hypothetical protein